MEQDKQGVTLAYAEHREFFEKYHEYREGYLESSSNCLFEDLKEISLAMKYLNKYVKCVMAQIGLVIDKQDIKKKQQTLISLYTTNKTGELLKQMDELFDEVEAAVMHERLIPKPEIEPIDEILTEKDDKIRYALEAYKIIYGR